MQLMNNALGGNFASRINMNLREKNGYSYGTYSQFVFRRSPGPFQVAGGVRTDATAPAVTEVFTSPTLALLIYVVLTAAAVVHELGHAAACHYGGADPGEVGAARASFERRRAGHEYRSRIPADRKPPLDYRDRP